MSRSRFAKSGFLAIAVVATLSFTVVSSEATAKARAAADCSTQVERAKGALTAGRSIDRAQVTALQRCVLSQPGQTADALAQADAGDATTPATEAVATVVASFSFTHGAPFCLEFNSDGTINPKPLAPIVVGVSGAYLGIPGVFTFFSITIGTPPGSGFQIVGVGIGPFLLSVAIQPSVPPLGFGFQVTNC